VPSLLTCLGGVAVTASPFLSWVHVWLLGNLSLPQLLSLASDQPPYVAIAVLLGLGAMVSAFTLGSPRLGVLACCIGAVAGLAGVAAFLELSSAIRQADGIASMGPGPIVLGLGAAVLLVGGISALSQPATHVLTEPPRPDLVGDQDQILPTSSTNR
jgi:hypothetical protein